MPEHYNTGTLEHNNGICGNCGLVQRVVTMTVRNQEYGVHTETLCDRCIRGNYRSCNKCGVMVRSGALMRIDNVPGVFCIACFEEETARCTLCSRVMLRGLLNQNNQCLACVRRHNIHSHDYKPTKWGFYNSRGNVLKAPSPKDIYLGVEIEVEFSHDVDHVNAARELKETLSNEEKEFIIKHDGSLQKGFEIVTAPRTLENWMKYGKNVLKEVSGFLLDKGCMAGETGTCGLHIHASRKPLTQECISNLIRFFHYNYDECVHFCRRHGDRWMGYSNELIRKVEARSGKVSNKEDYIEYITRRGSAGDRYVAVNIENKDTVEFRMFNGSINASIIMVCLQFVDSCISVCSEKNSKFDDIFKYAESKNYNELSTYLIAKGIINDK